MPSSTTPSDLPSRSTPSFPWPSSKRRRSGPSSSSYSSPPKPTGLRSPSSSSSARDNSLVDSSFAAPDPLVASKSRSPDPWSPSQPQQDLVDRISWTLEKEEEEDSDEDGRLSTKGRGGGGRRGMMRKMKSTTSLQPAVPTSFTRPRVSSKMDARPRRARSTLGFHHHPHHPPAESPHRPETLSFDPYDGHLLASSTSNSSSITITGPPSSPSPPSTPRGRFGSSLEVVETGHRRGVLEGVKWGTRRGTSLEVREGRKWENEKEEEEEGKGRWEEQVGTRVHPAIDSRW